MEYTLLRYELPPLRLAETPKPIEDCVLPQGPQRRYPFLGKIMLEVAKKYGLVTADIKSSCRISRMRTS